jgi:ABC-type branched-subunit amino acid transport system substrate-binding protein
VSEWAKQVQGAPLAVVFPCDLFSRPLGPGTVTDYDISFAMLHSVVQESSGRLYYRSSAAALQLVDVSGRALLDWVQQALTLSPGFVQVADLHVGRQPKLPQKCLVTQMSVMDLPFDIKSAYRVATTGSMALDPLYVSFAANVTAAGDVDSELSNIIPTMGAWLAKRNGSFSAVLELQAAIFDDAIDAKPLNPDCGSNTVRLGVLLPMSGAWPEGGVDEAGSTVAGAAFVARDFVNAQPGWLGGRQLEIAWRDSKCDASSALAALSDLLEKDGPIDAIIGPGCSAGCESSAFLTAGRSLPQVSFSCNSPLLSDKTKYPTFMRTSSSYTSWAPAFRHFMVWAGWRRCASISSSANVYALALPAFRKQLALSELSIDVDVRMDPGVFDPASLQELIVSHLRVVLVCADAGDTAAVAVAARSQLMIAVGWAWFGLDSVEGAFNSQLLDTRTALRGWIYLQARAVFSTPTFAADVKRAAKKELGFDVGRVSPYAANLYDAILLYATVLTDLLRQNGTRAVVSGAVIVTAMKDATIDGMTGRVQLDGNGDMKETIRVSNYRGASSVQVGEYDPFTRAYTPSNETSIEWPGATIAVPMDSGRTSTRLGVLLPMSGNWSDGYTIAGAVSVARNDVNGWGWLGEKPLEIVWVRGHARAHMRTRMSRRTCACTNGFLIVCAARLEVRCFSWPRSSE